MTAKFKATLNCIYPLGLSYIGKAMLADRSIDIILLFFKNLEKNISPPIVRTLTLPPLLKGGFDFFKILGNGGEGWGKKILLEKGGIR